MSRSEHRRKPRRRSPNTSVKNVAVLCWELDDDVDDDLEFWLVKNLHEHSDVVFNYSVSGRHVRAFGLGCPRLDLLRRLLCSSLGDAMVNDAKLVATARDEYRAKLARQRGRR
jgi:hypothetical protein